jgi:hypothetical protein
MSGTNFSLRGAMNADNPDTAKIINNLLSGLIKEGVNSIPDKQAQKMLQNLRMSARENEIVVEADVPEKTVKDFIWAPPVKALTVTAPNPKPPAVKKPVLPSRKKRTRKN